MLSFPSVNSFHADRNGSLVLLMLQLNVRCQSAVTVDMLKTGCEIFKNKMRRRLHELCVVVTWTGAQYVYKGVYQISANDNYFHFM